MRVDIGLLVLRVGVGLMMAGHGLGKVSDLFSGRAQFADPIGIGPVPSLVLAAFAEFVCALLVVLGLWTRYAAVPVLITMAVAALVVHGSDPFADKELALLYGIAFLALILTGGGRLAVDAKWGKKRRASAR